MLADSWLLKRKEGVFLSCPALSVPIWLDLGRCWLILSLAHLPLARAMAAYQEGKWVAFLPSTLRFNVVGSQEMLADSPPGSPTALLSHDCGLLLTAVLLNEDTPLLIFFVFVSFIVSEDKISQF